MSKVLSFSDIEAGQQSLAGCTGAALSEFSQSGFSVAMGFVVPASDIRLMLGTSEVRTALAAYVLACDGGSKEDTEASREHLEDTVSGAKLPWDAEMEAITRFRELDGLVSVRPSTMNGRRLAPVFAHSESSFLAAIGKSVGDWLLSCPPHEIDAAIPAVIVQEVVEAESSIEVKRKKDGFDVRAIFGLPEGLFDSSISSDHYHFDSKLELVESEEREQSWQHIPGKLGPEKVDVLEGFRAEPKVAEEQLDDLINLMTYMMEKEDLEVILIAVVDDNQIITDAKIKSGDTMLPLSLDQRSQSRTLISDMGMRTSSIPSDEHEPVELAASEQAVEYTPRVSAEPAAAPQTIRPTAALTNIILKIDGFDSLEAFSGDARNDVLLTGDWIGPSGLGETLAEALRKFPSSEIIVQMEGGDAWLKECIRAMARLGKSGGNFSLLLPGMRTLDEHRRTVKILKDTMPDSSDMPGLWACVAYPSNLFFLEELARDVDVVSADLENLALHMTGHTLSSKLRYDEHSLREALELLMKTVKAGNRPFSVHTPDFFGSPALLEFLIRRGANTLAVSKDEVEFVSQIIKTLEIKIAVERA